MTCAEGGDVREHLNKLLLKREELAAIGGLISNEKFSTIILASLPQSYSNYLSAITTAAAIASTKDDEIKLQPTILIRHVTKEYDRRQISNKIAKATENAALLA